MTHGALESSRSRLLLWLACMCSLVLNAVLMWGRFEANTPFQNSPRTHESGNSRLSHVSRSLRQTAAASAPAMAPPPYPMPREYDPYAEIKAFVQKNGPRSIKPGFLITPTDREALGDLMDALGSFHIGVELGVNEGDFSRGLLGRWKSCTRMYLVDLWAKQVNYDDLANTDDTQQQETMKHAIGNLQEWSSKTVFIRNYTTAAVHLVPDLVDFVYVDARHDYCGVMDDMNAWWPKLRPGGIMAGHDYAGARIVWPGQDWEKCANGTRHHGAVMGAVHDFALVRSLTVAVTQLGYVRSWIIRKPAVRSVRGGQGNPKQSR